MLRYMAVNFSLLQIMFKLIVLLVYMQVTVPAAVTLPAPACPETSPLLLGPLKVEFNFEVNLEQTALENQDVKPGGRYRPKDCVSSQKVAVIIPFRNRHEHLKYWLHYLHPIMQRQQLDYRVYVINQHGGEKFNRAKLFNVGFSEALKDYDYNCFVFSDVDMIPMDDRNIYGCFSEPRHLSTGFQMWNWGLLYWSYFGGVSSLSYEQFLKINGFPNNYWGWGGEDDDIYKRLVFRGMSFSRPNGEVGRVRNMPHRKYTRGTEDNGERFDQIRRTRRNMETDGINSLSYKVVRTDREALYTYITVDIGKRT